MVDTHAPGQNGSTNIANSSGSFLFFNDPSINNSGTVSFTGSTSSFTGIYTRAVGGSVTTYVGPGDGFQSAESGILNNNGELVFLGAAEQPDGGVFDGPIPSDVAIGQDLFGSPIDTLNWGTESINDEGQIAFWYDLANGNHGIAVATPVSVPEPRGVVTVALSAMLLLSIRQLRTRPPMYPPAERQRPTQIEGLPFL